MKKTLFFIVLTLLFITQSLQVFGQGKPFDGPEDPAGDISAERTGFMNGNRFLLYFENNTQISDWPKIGTSKWPNDYSGTRMVDVISVLIGTELYMYQDTIPIDKMDEVTALTTMYPDTIDTLYCVQSSSFGASSMDKNYDGTVEWGFYPVPGYFNEVQDYPAMSNKPDSWPPIGWPSTRFEKKWPGEWNGRFGRGVKYADLESYFVANDAQDMENIIQRHDPEEKLISDGPRYIPRPGTRIGDLNPLVTIQRGLPWGGLGLRVETRGYQWNNPEAKDIVFWEYNIANISGYDLPKCGFGYFIDNNIGGDVGGDNENGYFNDLLDLSYVWDRNNVGDGGNIPGVLGIAYLESPGRPYDNVDNDDDGLVDEKRDNPAGALIGATQGIQDVDKFLKFYKMKLDELKEHYEGDEDQDWQDGRDVNGLGTYGFLNEDSLWQLEEGDWPGNDVGLDGVGPGDINYKGPDEGECNHMPDFREGVGCEPNFAVLDVTESDMVGLTSFLMMDNTQWTTTYNVLLNQDEKVWQTMDSHTLSEFFNATGCGSLYEIFASTWFPFFKGRTERISMGVMAAYENMSSLNSQSHYAPQIFRLKEVAQAIYERDYRFAQPPLMPSLRAYPGDGKVILTWDNRSDLMTREPFLDNVNDFEGYKLYRATDKMFSDAQIITDGHGNKMFKEPLFQCDKIDSIRGYSKFGVVDGHAFYLGDDRGIKHDFIDENVQNGRTYYYAVVAYDYGVEDFNISPTENNIVIELDESEKVIRMGANVQIVVPRQKAAGYQSPDITINKEKSSSKLIDGQIIPELVDFGAAKPGHQYKVNFESSSGGHFAATGKRSHRDFLPVTTGIQVWDVTGNKPRRVYIENKKYGYPNDNLQYNPKTKIWKYNAGQEIMTDVFDGIQMQIKFSDDSVAVDYLHTDWFTGYAPINIEFGKAAKYFAYNYEIIFDTDDLYQSLTNKATGVMDVDGSYIQKANRVLNAKFPFRIFNKMFTDSLGNHETLDCILFDGNANGVLDWATDRVLVGYTILDKTSYFWGGTIFSFDLKSCMSEEEIPKNGDVYAISFTRPLSEVDSLCFTINPAKELNEDDLKATMNLIRVVPNPYIATNTMESAVANKYLNQGRQILFTNIPADCDIRIFTPSGILVDKIEVRNEPESGIVHWDLLSKEDLEIAAGMYIFHVKSIKTGHEKVGKFAVIK